ncbi:MAG TPA: hypothetical protein VNO84_03690 [Burkholderiaceae bacterium]|nr:hypothetical protein [Burkholderiaceae bacterium]
MPATPKRRPALLSLAGHIARRGRREAAVQSEAKPAQRGGWSSLIRLTPRTAESSPAPLWSRLKRPAPVFLCTDFAPSQWFKP